MLFSPQRHIQDPASQRLTWNKSPKSVLVIKKIRDASLLQPFKELCAYLMEVSEHGLQALYHPLKSGGLVSQVQELRSIMEGLSEGRQESCLSPLTPSEKPETQKRGF